VEWSDVFEWLWDVSEWQLSEVGHDWLLGELHELLFGLESCILGGGGFQTLASETSGCLEDGLFLGLCKASCDF